MVQSHFATLCSVMYLGVFGGMHRSVAAGATAAENKEVPRHRLRSRTTRTSAVTSTDAEQEMSVRINVDFDRDNRITIPVARPEDSHEIGRMLFNIDVDSTNGPIIDGTNNGSTTDMLPAADDSEVDAYIVNGRAAPQQQTWFALTMEEYNGQFYQGPCGATMISREWAVTAAHCISYSYKNDYKSRLDYLYVGAYQPWTADSYGNGNAGRPYEIIKIAQHIEHWNHRPGLGSEHDIALLRLERPVSSNFQAFQPIELGVSAVGGNAVGTVYGFGATYYQGRKSTYLQQATLPYVDHDKCKQAMDGVISDDMICFGGDGKSDICQGDSGGAVIVNNKVVGVTSWG